MKFSDDLKKFSVEVQTRYLEVFQDVTTEVQRSVVEGSEITGALGQPVGQYGPGYHPHQHGGFLRSSWISRFVNPWRWVTETDAPYAQSIEDGLSYAHGGSPMTLRSAVGGFHSVGLTIAGFDRIVAMCAKRRRWAA